MKFSDFRLYGAAITCVLSGSFASAQVLLDPLTQPRFVNALPVPPTIDMRAGGHAVLRIVPQTSQLGLRDPVTGLPLSTDLFTYGGTYPGPTILASKDVPFTIEFPNQLVDGFGSPLPHLLPIDTTLHWADPLGHGHHMMGGYTGPVPVVTHLHGGHTDSSSDGLPDAWYTPGAIHTGRLYNPVYTYRNDQDAATIWYHDHALGITRLNVYTGLAGFYLLTDEREEQLVAAGSLPGAGYDFGLAIQDKVFEADGSLHYPSVNAIPGTPVPSVNAEFFGDTMLVNGAPWPYLNVEPRPYRFRLLNGCDSRFLELSLPSGPKIVQIGSDQGLLERPLNMGKLLIAPGERAEVVIDFSSKAFWGKTLVLQNTAKTPYPNGAPPNPRTTGQVMAFKVVTPLNTNMPKSVLPATLREPIAPLVPDAPARQLLLFEGMDEFGRMKPMLGTVAGGAMMWDEPTTENPLLDTTEVWEIYNATPDAHPIHLHLVAFQVLGRQGYRATVEPMMGALSNIRLVGRSRLPEPNERGWKDTVIMYPGEVTRVVAKFDLPGEYAWHCHILSHEDHEMMRRFEVVLP